MKDYLASDRRVALTQLKVGARREITERFLADMPGVSNTAEFRTRMDDIAGRMILDLRARVLAEQLPPQTIHHTVRVETTDPRHATWWDAFKATYQQRWWMRWRRWQIRYVHAPVTVERTVEVSVRDHWTYPRAAIVLLPEFGSPVMVSTWTSTDRTMNGTP